MAAKVISEIIALGALVTVVIGQGMGYPRVTVEEGILVGKTVRFTESTYIKVDKNITLFLGVPYADPPERFAAPDPKTPWEGEWDATEFSKACMQPPSPSTLVEEVAEDCLYLNIYAPSPKPTNASVMVWIHGGGHIFGSAMTYDNYGVPLVAVGDVIVVAINYRLGVFSFLSTKDENASGNMGMLDQVAALKWIHKNIGVFGGDKERITIFGESAGGGNVGLHLVSHLSRDYFSQAVMQSGTAFTGSSFQNDPEGEIRRAETLGTEMGCDVTDSAAMIDCLRTKDAEEITMSAESIYGGLYTPTLDGTFLEDSPANLYARGDFKRAPVMVGSNRDEGTLLIYVRYFLGNIETGVPPTFGYGGDEPPQIPFNDLISFIYIIVGMYPSVVINDVTIAAILQEYTDWAIADDPDADYYQSTVNLGTDFGYGCPKDRVARLHAEAGDTVFTYLMTHAPSKSALQNGEEVPSTPWFGAGHGEDLTFMLGYPFIDELYNIRGHNLTDDENALSVKFMEYWTNFAKSGDPSKGSLDAERGEGVDSWPVFTTPELRYKELSLEMGEGRANTAQQCRFWNDYFVNLSALADNTDGISADEWQESYNAWTSDMSEWQRAFNIYKEGSTCN